MSKRIGDEAKSVLRERALASLPCTITQLVAASGYSHGTVAEALEMLVLAGLVRKGLSTEPDRNRNIVFTRLPHVPVPAVEPFVLGESRWKGQIKIAPRPKASKGSGVIAGPSYATGFRWRSAADNFL